MGDTCDGHIQYEEEIIACFEKRFFYDWISRSWGLETCLKDALNTVKTQYPAYGPGNGPHRKPRAWLGNWQIFGCKDITINDLPYADAEP
jgi:hypothetical protein